ncbi:MAG TPA: sulfotransferase family protein [Thermohalobaculum sp.]|nr:sulfotransferase family protein [Thermohalobaculum sp.]
MRLEQITQAEPAERAAQGQGQGRAAVLVLGMHRSGTSALTRVFSILGCDLPSSTVPGPSRSNPHGYADSRAAESRAVMKLNDAILASAGTSWDDWQRLGDGWRASPKANEFREKAQRVLADDFGDSYFFTLKDPRICRLPGFWIEALEAYGVRPVAVLPVRNPLDVAASLRARDGFEPRLGQLLWLRHVLDAEAGTRGVPRSFTSYESLLDGWSTVTRKAESDLGIVWPRMSDLAAAEIEAFVTDEHRHHAAGEARVARDLTLPDWLRTAYEIFSRWARSGEDEVDRDTLDTIRAELDASAPAFARLVRAGRDAAGEARALRQSLERTQARLEDAAAEAAEAKRLRDETARLEGEVAETRARLETAETERAAETRLAEDAQAALAALRAEAAERREELRALKEELSARVRTLSEARETLGALRAERQARAEELAAGTAAREQAAARLARAERELVEAVAARAEAEKTSAGYREHVALLLEDGRRHARELTELRWQSAAAAQLVRSACVALAFGRRLPGLGRFQARLAARRLRRAGLVDPDWYVAQNDDVLEAKIDPVLHFVVHGAAEGRAPHPLLGQDPRTNGSGRTA